MATSVRECSEEMSAAVQYTRNQLQYIQAEPYYVSKPGLGYPAKQPIYLPCYILVLGLFNESDCTIRLKISKSSYLAQVT